MQKTFQHEVTYLEFQPVFPAEGGEPEYKECPVKKTVTFKELNQLDRTQHDLHFTIMAFFTSGGTKAKGKKTVSIDPEFAKEMAVLYMDEMVVFDEGFTARDKESFLNDSAALMSLSFFLIPNKIVPFFQKLTQNISA